MPTILVVDDEPHILDVLEIALQEDGVDVSRAASGQEALDTLRRQSVDVVVSDIRMPGMSGVELLSRAREFAPDTAFIMVTAFATTDTAIEALQHGACEYLTKPFKMDDLRSVLRRVLSRKASSSPILPEGEAKQGQKLFQALHQSGLIGRSGKMMEVYRTIGTVAGAESTVLITGESGTGKELVARALHHASSRKDRPFISVNCGAFPETLLESELFGYMKGSFTGANSNRKGLLEAASGGSVFLDEIGEMTPSMQVKLLRVLQERRLRPLGSTAEIPMDVRVIAATNQDLQVMQLQGRFREDLYYRIAVIKIHLPPLRERAGDIPLLANHFLKACAEKSGKGVQRISPEAMRKLENYFWPGNVRELENTIERAVALECMNSIQPERLPEMNSMDGLSRGPGEPPKLLPEEPFDLEAYMTDLQRDLIRQALKQSDGNQTLAAQRLRLTKPSLRHKIHTLGIDAQSFRKNAGVESDG
jgi:two-component system, NtrC family, response regulator PilR